MKILFSMLKSREREDERHSDLAIEMRGRISKDSGKKLLLTGVF